MKFLLYNDKKLRQFSMEFERDENIILSDLSKHSISFETARQIFDRPTLSRVDDRRDYGEVRHISIGHPDAASVMEEVLSERDVSIRLISARPASRKERRTYHAKVRQGT